MSDLVIRPVAFSRAEMARRGRLGGLAKASRLRGPEATRAAREGILAKFRRLADPAGVLPPEDRDRLAAELRRDHHRKLALAAAEARRARAGVAA